MRPRPRLYENSNRRGRSRPLRRCQSDTDLCSCQRQRRGLAAPDACRAGSQVVRFSYKPGGDGSTRRVDPWSLHAEDGRWYLTGWDHERTSARTFRVSRIEGSVTLTAEPTTTERSAAPTASSEESEEDVEIGFVLPERQGAELRRHPTLRPSGTDAEGVPVKPRYSLSMIHRAEHLRCCGVRDYRCIRCIQSTWSLPSIRASNNLAADHQ